MTSSSASPIATAQVLNSQFEIKNKKGLHARASVKFVQTVEKFSSDVHVSRCGETVSGTSIMGLLTLGAAIGTMIDVTVSGDDAEECLEAIRKLLDDKFGEED